MPRIETGVRGAHNAWPFLNPMCRAAQWYRHVALLSQCDITLRSMTRVHATSVTSRVAQRGVPQFTTSSNASQFSPSAMPLKHIEPGVHLVSQLTLAPCSGGCAPGAQRKSPRRHAMYPREEGSKAESQRCIRTQG